MVDANSEGVDGDPAGFRPHGRIQKISQEGSKSTYMIILSKECIKAEAAKGGFNLEDKSSRKQPHEWDSQSPSEGVHVSRSKMCKAGLSDDVKLNLSSINDEEYDSNQSATSVFLKQDSGIFDHDSVLDENSMDCMTNSNYRDKSQKSSFLAPSHHNTQQQNSCSDQCTFHSTVSSHALSNDRSGANGRKVILANPSSADYNNRNLLRHHSMLYPNESVPVMNKSFKNNFQTPASLLQKSNSKAVPTFSNISPINQDMPKPKGSSYIPINSVDSPAYGASSLGPFTSTPVNADSSHSRQQQSKQPERQEANTHRPVYIIPSPFTRQNAITPQQPLKRTPLNESQSKSLLRSNSLNNSSGYMSASSSCLETPESTRSFVVAGAIDPGHKKASHVDHGEAKPASGQQKFVVDGSGGVVISVEDDLDEDLYTEIDNDSVTSSSQESSEQGEKAFLTGTVLNRSLTNIHWLKGLQGMKEERLSQSHQGNQYHNVQWTSLSPEDIDKISKEFGPDKRPPFSYMALIQMALCSRHDRRMMLKEICEWIEETFPYYKFTAKRGWKNSIRHNLSLYNIFERESGKRHGSYWTIRADVEPKTKCYQRPKQEVAETHRYTPSLPAQIPLIPIHSSQGQLSAMTPSAFHNTLQKPHSGKKKGPPPILPRPASGGMGSPYTTPQAYALIPLTSMNQQLNMASPSQQHMFLNLSNSSRQNSACPSPIISEVSAAVASIQVSNASPIPPESYCDPISLKQEHIYTKKPNILKQAWENCQSQDMTSSLDSECMTGDNMNSDFYCNRGKSKRPRVKPGLPKPTIYLKDTGDRKKVPASKRRKLNRKDKRLENESSDEDDGTKFISNLEKEIFNEPFNPLESEAMEEILTTSTPARPQHESRTDLPSPIHGLTPLRSSALFEGSFLTNLASDKTPDMKKSPGPNVSLLDFNDLPFVSPDKLDDARLDSPSQANLSNQNLSRFLSDYGLDQACDNPDNFPNLNWSVVQQMVDSMDTT